jgi:serine/threonine protein kinase
VAFISIENGPAKGERITLSGLKEYVAGRDSKAFIEIEDRLVSRRHFRIGATPTVFFLEDLESANGTFLNGIRIARKKRLNAGDRIQIGETRLTFLTDTIQDPLTGKTISGFEVLECVGRGGMGTVYKARQLSLDRFVALKVLSRHLVTDNRFAEIFHREARAAGQINHPSIVQVYDVDTVQLDDEDVTFFAMEYMPGGSVEDLINKEKQLDVTRALQITLDVSRGLQFAEKHGLVHRDIKPGNLMIGDTGEVKIVDLGIARRVESGSKASQEEGVSGSPHYISPEQARGRDIDSGADMYSLGISLYHMLAGRPPFLATTAKELLIKHVKVPPPPISEFRPNLPGPVVGLIERMIKKDRGERFSDGNDLVVNVDAVLRSLDGESGPATHLSPQAKRLTVIGISLMLLIVIGGSAGVMFSIYNDKNLYNQSQLNGVKENIEDLLLDAHILIENSEFTSADTKLGEVDRRLDGRDDILVAFPDLEREASELRNLLTDKQRQVVKSAYHRRSEEALEELLAQLEPDLSTVSSLEDLSKLRKQLESFGEEYSDTPASEESRKHLKRIIKAEHQTREQRRMAQVELARVTSRSETLLKFDPPRYRDATKAFEIFVEQYAETPAADRGKKQLEALRRDMKNAASKEIEIAEKLAREDKVVEALRVLRKLRAEVDGQAATMIDAALVRFRE